MYPPRANMVKALVKEGQTSISRNRSSLLVRAARGQSPDNRVEGATESRSGYPTPELAETDGEMGAQSDALLEEIMERNRRHNIENVSLPQIQAWQKPVAYATNECVVGSNQDVFIYPLRRKFGTQDPNHLDRSANGSTRYVEVVGPVRYDHLGMLGEPKRLNTTVDMSEYKEGELRNGRTILPSVSSFDPYHSVASAAHGFGMSRDKVVDAIMECACLRTMAYWDEDARMVVVAETDNPNLAPNLIDFNEDLAQFFNTMGRVLDNYYLRS
jgi:hypothetical protein